LIQSAADSNRRPTGSWASFRRCSSVHLWAVVVQQGRWQAVLLGGTPRHPVDSKPDSWTGRSELL